ncbi:Large neutral amino acids transporter small subunit 1 [Aphelenchoides bicaudatus]|nr:Large neutral amino acids transporter small subunit 1 [Aphelenchoides bicaudatus]
MVAAEEQQDPESQPAEQPPSSEPSNNVPATEEPEVNAVNGQKDALLSNEQKEVADLDIKPKTDPKNLAQFEEGEEGGLRKSLTLFNGISMIIGCIIGSGIFVSPTGVQKEAGSVGISLIIWLASGVFATLGAWSYAELGTMIRQSGGDYAYIKLAFGDFLAFMRLWIEAMVVRPCTCTIVALTFSIYILKPFFVDCDPPAGSIQALAALLLVLLTLVNCVSIRLATLIQDTFTVAKVFALLLIIGAGLYLLAFSDPIYKQNFENAWEGSNWNAGAISLAFYSGLFAYQGWNYLNFIVEELQNVQRNLPIAILVSCISVTVIYVLTNVALYVVVSPDDMNKSEAVAIDFANHVFGKFAFIMPIFVACSTLGSANGVIFTSSRLFFVGAREQQMPEILAMVNPRTRTPIPAVTLTGLLAIGYLALSNNVIKLINYIAISYWLAIAGAIASLFYFRIKEPDLPRPIKVNILIPIVFFAGCVFLVAVPIVASPIDTCIGLGIMLTAVPIYLIFLVWKPRIFANVTDKVTVVLKNCLGLEDMERAQKT